MQFKQKLIVFPTSRAIRENIFLNNSKDAFLPFCLTIDEFLKKAFFYSNKKAIQEEQKTLFLKEAIKFKEFKQLGISSNFTQFLKQSDYIFRFFNEISSEKISIDDIKNVDTYEFYKDHLNILKKVKENYINLLEKNNYIDRVNEYKYITLNKNFLEKFSTIQLHFEGYFTKVEFDKICEISKYKQLVVNLYTNEYNKKSFEYFRLLNFVLKQDYFYSLDLSNKKILSSKKIQKKIKHIDIKGFSSRISQIAYIKSVIVDCIQAKIDPSNIALILPDETFACIIRLFDDERYFNYAMGLDIKTSKSYKFLHSLYNYMDEEEHKREEAIEFFHINKEFLIQISKYWNIKAKKDYFDLLVNELLLFEEDKEIIEKIDEIAYKLKFLLFSDGINITFKEVVKIFFTKISQITIDDINSGKITVMGLLESRAITYETVIICDFNEEYIPKISLKDKFLSTKVKKFAKLPTLKDRENLQKYYYKRLLDNCKNIYVSYVSNDTSTISRFANELFDTNIDGKIYDNYYKHILYHKQKIKHFNKDIILNIDLSTFIWSATSLKVYLQCKRKFYLQYILKIKDHEITLKPKAYEIGSIIHKILYEYFEVKSHSLKRLEDLFVKYISKNPFLTLELEIWKKKIKDFYELEQQRTQDIEIIKKEMPFNIVYNNIKIKGVIDRIDKTSDGYLIIDYKTSSSLKVDTVKNYNKSYDFQLEFYFLAFKHLYKTSKVQAFYYDLNKAKLLEEVVLNEKLQVLNNIFKNLNTNSVNFSKCENRSFCNFCSFKTICNT